MALDRYLGMAHAVEEMVDRLVAVSACHNDRGSAKLVEALRQLATRSTAHERLGFLEVRRDDGCEWKEPRYERLYGIAPQQLCPGARDHDRVDDERDAPSL